MGRDQEFWGQFEPHSQRLSYPCWEPLSYMYQGDIFHIELVPSSFTGYGGNFMIEEKEH